MYTKNVNYLYIFKLLLEQFLLSKKQRIYTITEGITESEGTHCNIYKAQITLAFGFIKPYIHELTQNNVLRFIKITDRPKEVAIKLS